LQCPGHRGSDGTGSVMINGTLNVCAATQCATAMCTGHSVSLHGVATDDDSFPDPLSYDWSTPSAIDLGTTADLTIDCSTLGSSTEVVFSVSDGDCGDKYTLPLPDGCCSASPCAAGSTDAGGASKATYSSTVALPVPP